MSWHSSSPHRTQTAARGTLREELTSLVGRIPELRHLELGIELGLVPNHWDACLVSDFDSVADLESYQAHPEHVRVLGAINPLVAARAVVDYEV